MKIESNINFGDVVTRYPIHFDEFNLQQHQFYRASRLHGIMHTYRVMIHVLNLGVLSGFESEARTAFFAAYIHDMARKHDGYCTRHGADAAENHLDEYRGLFERNGASEANMLQIAFAVKLHSLPDAPSPEDVSQRVLYLLKDADALDRIRLGEDDLDTSFLRFDVSHRCIPFARQLYFSTNHLSSASFKQIIDIATRKYA
ncbi:MAG: hypothetical protein RBR28_02065 [Lentimicrobium sp.]|jgi:hypothetical protein|nr:hypothetical protein [Lentimicrobium sp.]